jgi:hypothetical protein
MSVYLGNDVVDLTSVHARGKSGDRRFTGKVLTDLEMDVLQKSGDPDSLLWCFWAAKESAYKALSRHDPEIPSSPKKYETVWIASHHPGFMTGTIRTPSVDLPVFCYRDREKICGLCFSYQGAPPVFFVAGVHKLENHGMDRDASSAAESRIVRKITCRSIAAYFGYPPEQIAVDKAPHGDAPVVTIHGRPSFITLTLSHDGPFLFFAWCLDRDMGMVMK